MKIDSANSTNSTYIIPSELLLLKSGSSQSSTFALMLDGPEFSFDLKNRYLRRLRLIYDGRTILLVRYLVPGTENSFIDATSFSTSARPLDRMLIKPFEVISRVSA